MFTVFYAPFPASLGANQRANVVLCRIKRGVPRILAQGLHVYGQEDQVKLQQSLWFELTADFLNQFSLWETRVMLRSIKEHIRQSEARSEQRRITPSFFRADFGRMDFSRPGQGGSGFDGYW